MIDVFTDPVLRAIQERRSIRKFSEAPVTRDEVLAILEAGRWAPSGKNNQPWRYLVVQADDPRKQGLEDCTSYRHLISGCQVCICVFLEKARMYHAMKDAQGAGACIQNMLLAAHTLGLGAVWNGQIVGQEAQVLQVLGLAPDLYELMAVLCVGRPVDGAGAASSPSRLSLDELCIEPV